MEEIIVFLAQATVLIGILLMISSLISFIVALIDFEPGERMFNILIFIFVIWVLIPVAVIFLGIIFNVGLYYSNITIINSC